MEKRVTVLVDYELGKTDAFKQGAAQAEQTASRQSEAYVREAKRVQGMPGKTGGVASALASGNIGGALGALGKGVLGGIGVGAAYAGAGLAASDYMNVSMGGPLMRGSGFIGMLDSIYGTLSGRGMLESKRSWKIEEGQFQSGLVQQRLEMNREFDSMRRSVMFRPVTEADPLRRIEQERRRIELQQRQAKEDQNVAMGGYSRITERFNNNKIIGMDAGKDADWAVMKDLHAKMLDDLANREKEIAGIAAQRRDYEHQILSTRKESIRDSRIAFGAALPQERGAAAMAAGRLKRGESLMPEEIGLLGRFGIAQQPLNEYLAKRGEQAGFKEFAAIAGDEETQKAAKAALAKQAVAPGVLVNIEAELTSEKIAQLVQEKAKRAVEEVIGQVKNVVITRQDVEQILRDLQNRQKTAFTR